MPVQPMRSVNSMTADSIRISGIEICVHARGPTDRPVVLFLHGPFSSAHTWEVIIDSLADEFRCIAVDLPACGCSPIPPPAHWTLQSFVQLIDGILDWLSVEFCSLVGTQMGGSIAVWYAAVRSHRVERLSIMSAGILVESPSNMRFYRALAHRLTGPFIQMTLPRVVFAKLLNKARGPGQPIEPDQLSTYLRQFRRRGSAQARIALDVRRTYDSVRAFLIPRLSRLTLPVLLVYGEADPIVPVDAGGIFRALLSGSQLLTLAGCGDFPQEEFPGLLSQRLKAFLGAGRVMEGTCGRKSDNSTSSPGNEGV